MDQSADQERRRTLFGRRRGKTLRPAQRQYLDQDLAALSPGAVDPSDNPSRCNLDMAARFAGKPVWLEVGFGGGEHLVHQARANPQVELLGCEPFMNGVAMLLGKLRSEDVENVSVYAGDVRDLFDVLPNASIAKTFLLYPDPWPKKRHHERRFVTDGYMAQLSRVMAEGGELRVATDIEDYVRQTLNCMPRHRFERVTPGDNEGRRAWADWHTTRYEQKALAAGRAPTYMTFRRA